ncbi:hypothetical protein Tco_1302509 [Tanacetum coccineum]
MNLPTKQALGFQNHFYLKKAQQLEPKLYDGNVIEKTNAIVIPDSEETLMLAEESHSKMLLKQQDPMMLEKKVNTTPVDYVVLNQLSQDFEKQFVPQTELSGEQAFWKKEIFQRDNSVSNQSAPSFDQLFELNELKAQSQEKDTVIKKLKERIKSLSGKMNEDKIKKDIEETETINIELDHRVSKLISVEIFDLNASLQEKVLEIIALKDDLRKLKGKAIVDNVVTKHTIDPEMLKIDVEPITPKLKPKKSQTNVPVSKSKVIQIVLWYLDSGCSKHMIEDRSQLTNFVNKFLGTVIFGNDHMAKIMGYGDYHIGNVTISMVYYVEGLGDNLFSVG